MTKFDDLIHEVGENGTYQKRLLFLVLCVVVASGYNTNLPMILLTIPKHRCALDNYPNDTYATQSPHHQTLVNASIPLDDDGDWDQCHILRSVSSLNQVNKLIASVSNVSVPAWSVTEVTEVTEVKCDRWVFDRQYFDRSAVEELSIVCDRKQWRAHGNSAMMVGKLVSAIIQGLCSDYFGRRKTLLAFILILITSTFAQAFIFDIPSLIAFRFFSGLATTSTYLNCFVIALESIGPSYRQTYSVVVAQSWSIGGFMLVGVAWFVRDYTHLALILGGPTVLLLSYYWLMPESPRWLASKGRTKEAKVILTKMAEVNGVDFPERLFEEMVAEVALEERHKKDLKDAGSESKETVIELMRHKRLALRMVIILWNWVANSLTYYGIMLNVQNLTGSIYLNFTFAMCVDSTGNLISYFLVDRLGRKLAYQGFLLLACVACLSAIFPSIYATSDVSDVCLIVLSMVGRLGITSFNVLYLYSAEMFPTTVRNSAMGVSSLTSRLGAISAPYVADLGILIGGDLKNALPLVVFGGAGLSAFISSLFLPETNGQKLPDTIQEIVARDRSHGDQSGRVGRRTKWMGELQFKGIHGSEGEEECHIKSQGL